MAGQRLTVCSAAALTLLLLAGQAAAWDPPSWYHGKDGPIFTVIKDTGGGVTQRRYQAEKWAAVNISGQTYDDAFKTGTSMLNDFWNGNNQQHADVDDTAPRAFMLLYPAGQGRALTTTFTIEYFLPHELHTSPPQPLAQEVQVVDVPAYDVWVKTFGGYAPQEEVANQAFDFMDSLKQSGVDVQEGVVGLALYDEPSRVLNRHNEIWVWEKQAPPSLASAIQRLMQSLLAGFTRRVGPQ